MKFQATGAAAHGSDANYERDDAQRLAAMSPQARAVCWCSLCGMVFTHWRNFDAHRTIRGCLTPEEMRTKGYAPNDEGRWRKPDQTGRWD